MQGDFEFPTRLTLIQQLIPSGLMAVEEILQEEGTHSAGRTLAGHSSAFPELHRRLWRNAPSGDRNVSRDPGSVSWLPIFSMQRSAMQTSRGLISQMLILEELISQMLILEELISQMLNSRGLISDS